MVTRGRARGRFPLREPAFKPPVRRRQPPRQPLAQTVAVGIASETSTALAAVSAVSAGTDTFERADAALSAPWAAFGGKALPSIVSGDVFAAADVTMDAAAYSVLIGPDMASEIIFSAAATVNTNLGFDVYTRISALTAGADYYIFKMYSTGWRLYKRTGGGAETIIAQTNPRPQILSTITGLRCTAVGSTLTGYALVSGVWTQVIQITGETSITGAGYAGFGTQLASGGANPIGIEQATWGAPPAQTIPVGLATETETAQPVAVHLNRYVAVGTAAETDAAFNVTGGIINLSGAGPRRAVGSRGRARGRYPHRGKVWDGSARREWVAPNTAGSATQTISVGLATETDSALFLVSPAQTVPVGLASETDTALRVLRERRYKSGFPFPIDTVFAGPFVVAVQIVETDSSLAATHRKTKTLGVAVESQTAHSITASGTKIVGVGLAIETDTSQTVRPVRTYALGLTSETDTSQALTKVKLRTLGLNAETDTAQVIRPARVRPVGLASETDSSLAPRKVKSRTLGLAVEQQTAFSTAKRKLRLLGLNEEADSARPISHGAKIIPVSTATEISAALPVGKAKVHGVSILQESETAQPITAIRQHITVVVGLATELDEALSFASSVPVLIAAYDHEAVVIVAYDHPALSIVTSEHSS